MALDKQKLRIISLVTLFSSVLLLFLTNLALSADPGRKNVLLLSPYHPETPFYRSYFAGIREACNQLHPGQIEIFQEFLDTVRIRDAEYINHLPDYYRIKYASIGIDAVIEVGATVEQFATRIFPGISVISSDTNNFYLELRMLDIRASVDLIHRLQPTVKKLFVIIGSHGEEVKMAELMRQTEGFFPNLEFTYTQDYSFEELMRTIPSLPANSAIMFLNFLMDRKGASFIPADVARKVSQAANCPSYAVVSTVMGTGIVGGVMLDAHRAGLLTGREVLKTLYGNERGTGDEPSLLEGRLLKQVDEREMLRWGLSESNLPPGFEVINRGPSLWRDHKYKILLFISFIILEGVLILLLLIQRKRKIKTEKELLRSLNMVEEKQRALNNALQSKSRILESLHESELTLQTIIFTIPIGVLIVEAGTGIIRQANRIACELLKMSAEDLIGHCCPGFCRSCAISESHEKVVMRAMEPFENCICNGQGKETYVLQTIDSIILNGKPHIVECFLDITERKTAEGEAQEREAQLVHADKMISLGVMAAGITHEINNPNNFISLNAPMLKTIWEGILERLDEYAQGNGDFLVGRLPYSHARKRVPVLLDGIIDGSERISNIAHDMKEFVSPKPLGISEKVDINTVLRSSLNLLAGKLNKSTDNLSVEYGENIPAVEANAQHLTQVAINLILNGIESLSGIGKSLNIKSFYESEKGMVVLEVRDNGSGIEPEQMQKIFKPFFTTKRETGGTGLGLPIARKIAETYGGQILISSCIGKGTTAILELPACHRGN